MLHMASSSQMLGGQQAVAEPLNQGGGAASRKVHLRKSRNRGKTNTMRRRRRSMAPEKMFPEASEAFMLDQGKCVRKK